MLPILIIGGEFRLCAFDTIENLSGEMPLAPGLSAYCIKNAIADIGQPGLQILQKKGCLL